MNNWDRAVSPDKQLRQQQRKKLKAEFAAMSPDQKKDLLRRVLIARRLKELEAKKAVAANA